MLFWTLLQWCQFCKAIIRINFEQSCFPHNKILSSGEYLLLVHAWIYWFKVLQSIGDGNCFLLLLLLLEGGSVFGSCCLPFFSSLVAWCCKLRPATCCVSHNQRFWQMLAPFYPCLRELSQCSSLFKPPVLYSCPMCHPYSSHGEIKKNQNRVRKIMH